MSALRRCLLADGSLLLAQVSHAANFVTRLKGLLGRDSLDEDEGILIEPCHSVHTLGMRFEIAVVFLAWDNSVLHVIDCMRPGRLSPVVSGARRVLELHPDRLARHPLQRGDQLRFEPVS